ncbi:hypothetical protein REPUB_Repub19eG0108900 [Reevesia pubescens]
MRKQAIIRSSLNIVVPTTTLFLILLLQFDVIHSRIHYSSQPTTYMVGDEEGWDLVIDMQSWARGKNFHAGDIIVFKYDDQMFDVTMVNQAGHDSCNINDGAKVFESGNDKIQLAFGANYFIDSTTDVCATGMKMAINATAPPLLI